MAIDTLWGYIFKNKKHSDNIELLKNIPIFSTLQFFDLKKLSKLLHLRRFYPNEIVFRENEPAQSLYIVRSGMIKVHTQNKVGDEVELALLEEGMFFGEVALVDESPRSASAIALEKTELLGLLRSDLMNLTDRDPRLASLILLQLSRIVSHRLRETNRAMHKLTRKS